METSSASTLRKVCPQCSTTVHVRRAVCGCGYAFPSKRRARPDSAILAEGLHFSALVAVVLTATQLQQINLGFLLVQSSIFVIPTGCLFFIRAPSGGFFDKSSDWRLF